MFPQTLRPLLKLNIGPAVGPLPELPDEADPGVELWREQDGSVCALGQVRDGACWMHFPDVASYRFEAAPRAAEAFPLSCPPSPWIEDTYYRSVLPMRLQLMGLEALHAGAVTLPSGVIGFCGVSGTGKSTITYGMGSRGHSLWADDAVIFQCLGSSVRTFRLPFSLRLRAQSRSFFGESRSTIDFSETLAESEQEEAKPLKALFILERKNRTEVDSKVEIRKISSCRAFTHLLTHAYCFSLHNTQRKQKMIENYLALAARIPVFLVRFCEGLDLLDEMLDQIERIAGKAFAPTQVA